MRVSRHCAICLFALTALASSVKFANADFFQSTNVNLGGWAYASDRYYDDLNALDYGIEVSDRFNNVSVNTATQDLKVTWWGSVETGTISMNSPFVSTTQMELFLTRALSMRGV